MAYGLKVPLMNKVKISNCRRNCIAFFFDVKKQRPKPDLKNYYQCSTRIEIYLEVKACFP